MSERESEIKKLIELKILYEAKLDAIKKQLQALLQT
jgi:tRNA(Ser,Leu) C12 N-acetylase TAN1